MPAMAMTPTYALAHVFIPNLIKLKGAATLISAIERKELAFLDQLWSQAHITHNPKLMAAVRDGPPSVGGPFRIGVFDLPPPQELGEAHMVGMVVKRHDPSFSRYFTLERDYVLSKKAERTLVCERDGANHRKHFDGPVLTGDWEKDAVAWIDSFMELMIPTRVQPKK